MHPTVTALVTFRSAAGRAAFIRAWNKRAGSDAETYREAFTRPYPGTLYVGASFLAERAADVGREVCDVDVVLL